MVRIADMLRGEAAAPPRAPVPPAFLGFEVEALDAAEALASAGDRAGALARLRDLGLDGFARAMWAQPMAGRPALAAMLPRMAASEEQKRWTGYTGEKLRVQSVETLRALALAHAAHAGRPMQGARMLDFGCGYGRFLRLMTWFSDPDAIAGCDPWRESVDACAAAGIASRVDRIGYVTDALPYADESFDVALAYSVFTHTNVPVIRHALAGLRRALRPGGLLACTIRPVEYFDAGRLGPGAAANARRAFARNGLVFLGQDGASGAPDGMFGIMALTLEAFLDLAPGWRFLGQERPAHDPYQRLVFLARDDG